jgi:hypothetical protein
MKTEKNQVIEQTPEQASPGLADPRQFKIVRGDEFDGYGEFGGQCGSSQREYDALIAEGERMANASNFDEKAEQHPNANTAGKPRTEGIGRP